MAIGPNLLWAIWLRLENKIVASILQIPAFHHGVRRIHRIIHDAQHGRDPNEPLRQGEATEDPETVKSESFMKHFVEELRNQAHGTPTEVDNPSPPPTSRNRDEKR
ncbi:hypothetical protein QBC34DRAFT_386384 [Podospora aff. communis PSN243]|uniref:Uncharacterized protein n=1 Tax=Podospora aff. communis PSN243 TaxID=3040156 RepID=A0AAV9G424_9PEZI|nr:hypothetical protein QBC34DRAFT_386384 [Podospora aff. communis PSN243]